MWCANCQADVAAEVTADNRGIRCAACGSEIATSKSSQFLRTTAKTREARQLLERWSNHQMLDPSGPMPSMNLPSDVATSIPQEPSPTAAISPVEPPSPGPKPASKSSAPVFRYDVAHAVGESATVGTATPHAPIGQELPAPHAAPRIHGLHEATPAKPHFDVQAAIQDVEQQKGAFTSLIGHLLAYGGVGVLTIGTVFVLWGYFGGPDSYAPTGWLIATVGQMLLFLGVVTLVSGGMEQTTDAVSRRIDTLGDKILRIEQVSCDHALRGPKIPAARFAENADPSTMAESHQWQHADPSSQ